ncbi:hypothetical protein VCHC51A1_2989, partial [Vibrio cholerae HC-51A1]
MAVKISACG